VWRSRNHGSSRSPHMVLEVEEVEVVEEVDWTH